MCICSLLHVYNICYKVSLSVYNRQRETDRETNGTCDYAASVHGLFYLKCVEKKQKKNKTFLFVFIQRGSRVAEELFCY